MTIGGVREIAGHDRMIALGVEIAGELRAGDVVLIHGDLGAGKTTLTQGIAAGLGVTDQIQSPTFGIVAEYDWPVSGQTRARLRHLDLYRLESIDDLESIDYASVIAPDDGITIIEWPERAEGWLPTRFMLVRISYVDIGARLVEIGRVDGTR